jgi:hypothetical protein
MSEVNPELHVNSVGTLPIRRNSGGGAEASDKEEEEETCDGLRIAAIPQCMSNLRLFSPRPSRKIGDHMGFG